MVNRSRRCLHYAVRTVNVIISFIGVLMIIYSLWVLKKWKAVETAEGSSEYDLLYPWFIFAFLAIGISVFFSMLCGNVVANSINVFLLISYVVFVCSILFLQVGVVILIFFKDWVAEINEGYAGQYSEFEGFVTFHLKLCRYITLLMVLLQAVGFVLALMLCAWRPGSSTFTDESHDSETPRSSLNQSFLICNDSQPSLPSLRARSTNNERTPVEEIS
ncbi:unnamed protein product [Victoria cruziana]